MKGEGASPRKEFFYWGFGKFHAARMGKWKLHIQQRAPVHYGKEIILEQPELYDVEADLSEKYDRFEEFPEEVEKILKRIEEHKASTADALPDNLAKRIETAEE